MTLDEFCEQEKEYLGEFQKAYEEKHQENPEDFPNHTSRYDWQEEYELWKENI